MDISGQFVLYPRITKIKSDLAFSAGTIALCLSSMNNLLDFYFSRHPENVFVRKK